MTSLSSSSANASKRAVSLPGLHRVVRQKAGKFYLYLYSGRGAGSTRLAAFSGASLAECEAQERHAAKKIAAEYALLGSGVKNLEGKFSSVIRVWLDEELPTKASSTQRVWRGIAEKIDAVFGDTPVRAMETPKVRQFIMSWHRSHRDHPRAGDHALTVLSAILGWAVESGRMSSNQAVGISSLDSKKGKRAGILWTAEELERLLANCSPEVARAVRLAALTGYRLSHVVTLRWDDIDDRAIRAGQPVRRGKRCGRIPLYPALRALLDECPKVEGADCVILNSRGRPWKDGGLFDSSFRPALRAAGIDKHFHDLRGTAATHLLSAGFTVPQIASALGWSLSEAENVMQYYVDHDVVAERHEQAHQNPLS